VYSVARTVRVEIGALLVPVSRIAVVPGGKRSVAVRAPSESVTGVACAT
jgi:hypothetical protein